MGQTLSEFNENMMDLSCINLQRYLTEDILYLKNGEPILLVIDQDRDNYDSWVEIYKSQPSQLPPVQIGRKNFTQIKANILKNTLRQEFISGQYDQSNVLYLL